MARTRTLDSYDPFAPTAGSRLADLLGEKYPHVFAEVTGVPLWADEAPLSACQRKWERYATKYFASKK